MKALVVLLLTASASAQMSPPQVATFKAEHMDLHGPVRRVHTETRANCASDPRCPPPFDIQDETFSRDGWVTEVIRTHPDGRVAHFGWHREGPLLQYEVNTTEGATPYHEVTKYDAKERPIEGLTYNPDGTLRIRIVRHYEQSGIYETRYDGDGRSLGSYLREAPTVVKTTASGTHSERRIYWRDGNLDTEIIKDTDRNGSRTQDDHKKDGILVITVKDAAGHFVTQTTTYLSKSSMKSSSDPDGRVIRSEHFDADGTLRKTTTLQYDKDDEHGNWVRQTITEQSDGRPPRTTVVVTRTITYFSGNS